MRWWFTTTGHSPLFVPLFVLLFAPAATVAAQDGERLRELLYGEALFHSQQRDYAAAISRLQLAEEQGLLPASSEQARLLLARMKLAYGMHLEAGFDLHALPGEAATTVPERNRAWYELGRAFYNKGYNEAAMEALARIQGDLPADIAGDHQLLQATLLMSQGRNREAQQELAQWRGPAELAAYGYYNRGIAMVRADEHASAVPMLQKAVTMPARTEELLALRDKARLSLGYVFANQQEYRRAKKQLEAVRPQGPFSNRALLALGWLEYKQGRSESALVSWTRLRGRPADDPAVLETLLIVPAVHRELDALQAATRDYEQARAAYSNELDSLRDARESVQRGSAISLLLQPGKGAGQNASGRDSRQTKRFLGPLLASRNFRELAQDHGELQAMLDTVDQGLQEIDVLAGALPPAAGADVEVVPTPAAVPRQPGAPTDGSAQTAPSGSPATPGTGIGFSQQWVEREGPPTNPPPRGIPRLPEVESPADRPIKPLPGSDVPRSRPAPRPAVRPPTTDVFAAYKSEILNLPESGEFFGRPASGEFFRRPGEEELEDYAYPDVLPKRPASPRERYGYRLNQLLPPVEEERGFNPGAVPVGEALRELATALNSSTERMAQLGDALDPAADDADLRERIAALRGRIIRLRARIANAIVLYEDYTRALALEELDRRQYLLEDLLQQASLELAKTYDQRSAQ